MVGFVLLPVNSIIGHDRCAACGFSIQPERSFRKGTQMGFKIAAGVYGVFAEGVVGVPSAFASPASGPMLGHSDHAAASPAGFASFRGLKPVAKGFGHSDIPFHVAAEGVPDAEPAGIAAQVNLGT